MSIRGQNAFRMLLVSLVLVFSLNSVASAADNNFGEWELQVIHRFSLLEDKLSNIYSELIDQGLSLDSIDSFIETCSSLLGDIKSNLYYNGKSAAYYLYKIESHLSTIANNSGTSGGSSSPTDLSGVLEWLETATGLIGHTQLGVDAANAHLNVISNYLYQVSAKLDGVSSMVTSLNTATTYLSWIDSDVEDVLSELETATGLIGLMQVDVDALVTAQGVSHDLIAAANTNLTTMINKQELVFDYLADLSGDLGTVISNQSAVLPVMQEVSGKLSSIYDALLYNDREAAEWLYMINYNMFTRLDSVIGNQKAILALLQQDGAFTTDLSGVLADLGTVISNQASALPVLQSVSDSLSTISSRLYYVDASFAHYVYIISYELRDKLPILISNQEAILALLQQDGAFTTDLSGVLANLQELSTTLSNINNALSAQGDRLSSIRTYVASMDTRQQLIQETLTRYSSYLGYNGFTLANYAYQINENLVNKMATVSGNQEAILALLQQDGAFTTDISGILADLDMMISNQGAALPVLQSMSESLTTISDRLYYVDASLSYYVWNISYQLRNNLPTMVANQQVGLENQQKLIDLIEDLELTTNVTIENIENITIDVTNKAYEVFYITDSEGNEQNLADFSGDVLTISGRLLNFFFKVAFDDAMDSVDSALDDMTEFYLDDSVVVGGSSLWE